MAYSLCYFRWKYILYFFMGTILPIDDYTLFKLSEKKYVPTMHYTVNILKLCSD